MQAWLGQSSWATDCTCSHVARLPALQFNCKSLKVHCRDMVGSQIHCSIVKGQIPTRVHCTHETGSMWCSVLTQFSELSPVTMWQRGSCLIFIPDNFWATDSLRAAKFLCPRHHVLHRDLKLENILITTTSALVTASFSMQNVPTHRRLTLAVICKASN